jgi:hypothetical protein
VPTDYQLGSFYLISFGHFNLRFFVVDYINDRHPCIPFVGTFDFGDFLIGGPLACVFDQVVFDRSHENNV